MKIKNSKLSLSFFVYRFCKKRCIYFSILYLISYILYLRCKVGCEVRSLVHYKVRCKVDYKVHLLANHNIGYKCWIGGIL